MKKWLMLFSSMIVFGSALAFAGPCDEDFDKYCGDVQPGQGQLENCVNSQRNNFTSQCREWLTKMDSVSRRLGMACSMPAREFCRDVRPGYGRVKACLHNNWDKLPKTCQDALNAQ